MRSRPRTRTTRPGWRPALGLAMLLLMAAPAAAAQEEQRTAAQSPSVAAESADRAGPGDLTADGGVSVTVRVLPPSEPVPPLPETGGSVAVLATAVTGGLLVAIGAAVTAAARERRRAGGRLR